MQSFPDQSTPQTYFGSELYSFDWLTSHAVGQKVVQLHVVCFAHTPKSDYFSTFPQASQQTILTTTAPNLTNLTLKI